MDDQTFAALAHAYRRQILLALAARDPDDPAIDAASVVPAADSQELRLSLYHTHLPKLESAGLVEWDDDLEVSRGPTFGLAAPILEVLDDGIEARQVPA